MLIEKVLLVDDDAAIRRIAALALSRVGNWNVAVADCGNEAIELVSDFRPDLILLDVMMPGMDGPTTLETLRKNGVDTPVIFMTAKAQRHEIQSYYKLGAAGIIVKPFDPMLLPQQIQNILNEVVRSACIA